MVIWWPCGTDDGCYVGTFVTFDATGTGILAVMDVGMGALFFLVLLLGDPLRLALLYGESYIEKYVDAVDLIVFVAELTSCSTGACFDDGTWG